VEEKQKNGKKLIDNVSCINCWAWWRKHRFSGGSWAWWGSTGSPWVCIAPPYSDVHARHSLPLRRYSLPAQPRLRNTCTALPRCSLQTYHRPN